LVDMLNRKHTNPNKKNMRKPLEWIIIDSVIIGAISMGASMPSTVPTLLDCWVMFKGFFIAFIFQLAVERGLKRKEG